MAQHQATTLRLVVAAAGYGKTTTLRRTFLEPANVWRRVRSIGELLDGGLVDLAANTRHVVLDDLPLMSAEDERALLRAIASLPDAVSVTISSRWPVDVAATPGLARFSRAPASATDAG